MRAGSGNVGKINGKVFFAIGTPVYGKDEIDDNWSSGFGIADVVKSSCCGTSPRATLSAERTGSILVVASPTFLMGTGNVVNVVYSYGWVGTIFTGTGHNKSILAGLENKE